LQVKAKLIKVRTQTPPNLEQLLVANASCLALIRLDKRIITAACITTLAGWSSSARLP
jgi:hypothetical protein